MITSGNHLSVVRNWIKRNATNGEHVKWGSYECLSLYSQTPRDLEHLAQDIRNAVLKEMRVKDKDYNYRYQVFCTEGCAAFQKADNFQEIWNCLFKAKGKVGVHQQDKDGQYRVTVFQGTADEAREWCRKFTDE